MLMAARGKKHLSLHLIKHPLTFSLFPFIVSFENSVKTVMQTGYINYIKQKYIPSFNLGYWVQDAFELAK